MLRALREQHCRFGMIYNRDKHRSGTDRPDFGDPAHHRVGIMIAACRRHVWVGEARWYVERQSCPHAREKFFARERRQRMLHQANSRTALASAMAKNSPCEATPNIALPSTSRSSPSATKIGRASCRERG